MKIRRFLIGLIFLVVFTLLFCGASRSGIYFEMSDPVGDEHGYGTYQYPTNIAFKPYQGLFDITGFKVAPGGGGVVCFDTIFLNVTNPWMAPEGFIHQNLRIFIDTKPRQGLVILPHPGANVKFNPKYAWEICLRIVGWGNSQLLALEDSNTLRAHPLRVELLADKHTIRAYVPESYIGKPAKNWHYYVLVGSYDGFGEDFFRKLSPKPGEWVIGGGHDLNIEPRVLDILAPKSGAHSQAAQLRSFNPEKGQFAEMHPVGSDLLIISPLVWLTICLIILLLSGAVYLICKKPSRISWFWIRHNIKDLEGK
ncbi:MAG: glucodextranase DOMON-like domain-containing protein [Bacillota bacterium]